MKKLDRLFYKFQVEQGRQAYKDGLRCVLILNDNTAVEFSTFKTFRREFKRALKVDDVLGINFIRPTKDSNEPAVRVYERKEPKVYSEYE